MTDAKDTLARLRTLLDDIDSKTRQPGEEPLRATVARQARKASPAMKPHPQAALVCKCGHLGNHHEWTPVDERCNDCRCDGWEEPK